MNAAWQYPFDINSIADTHPELPQYMGQNMPWFDFDAQKQQGDPFDPQAALQAEKAARTLMDISST